MNNIQIAQQVSRKLKNQARNLQALPNNVTMLDARAIAFADLGTAIEYLGTVLAQFITTHDKAMAKSYLTLVGRCSEAIGLLSGSDETPAVGRSLLSAQEALVAVHGEFSAHVQALLDSNHATVQA